MLYRFHIEPFGYFYGLARRLRYVNKIVLSVTYLIFESKESMVPKRSLCSCWYLQVWHDGKVQLSRCFSSIVKRSKLNIFSCRIMFGKVYLTAYIKFCWLAGLVGQTICSSVWWDNCSSVRGYGCPSIKLFVPLLLLYHFDRFPWAWLEEWIDSRCWISMDRLLLLLLLLLLLVLLLSKGLFLLSDLVLLVPLGSSNPDNLNLKERTDLSVSVGR